MPGMYYIFMYIVGTLMVLFVISNKLVNFPKYLNLQWGLDF